MRTISPLNTILLASTFLTATAFGAMAQDASTVPAVVEMTLAVRQYTLSDSAETDTFVVTLQDAQAKQSFTETCTPGKSGVMAALFDSLRKDETCKFTKGTFVVVNPKNGKDVKVGDLIGYFMVNGAKDGLTPMNTVMLDPTRGGEQQLASGSVIMKPEDPQAELLAEAAKMAESFKGEDAISVGETTDSIFFRDFSMPASGYPKEVAPVLNGKALYIYDRGLWRMDLTVTYGNESYRLAGDMEWVVINGEAGHTADYVLDLQVPQNETDIFAEDDIFAEVDGVKATLKMNGADATTVAVTDKFSYDVEQKIDVTGTFEGTNVPLPVVRLIAQAVATFARANWGA